MRGPLLVVSHAGVVAANRAVYAALIDLGIDVQLVVPATWRTPYAPHAAAADPPGALEGRLRTVAVVGRGRPQRHAYLARCGALLRASGARTLRVAEEPFSVAAWQWGRAASRLGVPFGVQLAETLDRAMPAVATGLRRRALARAAFVVARSERAAELAVRWGVAGEVAIVPHDVAVEPVQVEPAGLFTVCFVGRLVAEKGIEDLLEAVGRLDGVRLVVAGAGPLADEVARAGPAVEALGALAPADVGRAYARAHVTCVPSRTTARWEEQFGRVAVESLVRGVPVVASDTGSLPWVLARTGGGVTVPERDPTALAAALGALRDDDKGRRGLGAAGHEGALGAFSTSVVAAGLAGLLERVS